MSRVSIAESSSNWLVNKDYIVLFNPSVVILDNLVGSHDSWSHKVRAKLHEVT